MTRLPANDSSEILAEAVEYQFRNDELALLALTHKSYANENLSATEDNQRLEFLGDAVLGLVVAEALMERLPTAPEGQLTPMRAALVKESTLADIARRIKLGDLLRLGKGEEMNNGRDRSSILADAVEAVVGAVYLDGGYAASREAVLELLGDLLDQVAFGAYPDDPKTALQEILQANSANVPRYRVVDEEGPDHAKVFEVEISVDDKVLARGRGRSKKQAEKDAARRALKVVEKE